MALHNALASESNSNHPRDRRLAFAVEHDQRRRLMCPVAPGAAPLAEHNAHHANKRPQLASFDVHHSAKFSLLARNGRLRSLRTFKFNHARVCAGCTARQSLSYALSYRWQSPHLSLLSHLSCTVSLSSFRFVIFFFSRGSGCALA